MRKILVLMLTFVIALAVGACGNKEDGNKETSGNASSEESDIAYVKDKGTLVVGITDFEPMDYKDESGK